MTETEPPAVEKALNETSMLLCVGGHCTPDFFLSLSAALRVYVALLVLCEMRQCSLCYHVQLSVNVALLVRCEMRQCAVMYS